MISINMFTKLRKSEAIQLIADSIKLFDGFDKVYVFGSILDTDRHSNDIDILLLYSVFSARIESSIACITHYLESISGYPLDITALSFEEEKEINFIYRLSNRILCVK